MNLVLLLHQSQQMEEADSKLWNSEDWYALGELKEEMLRLWKV